METASLVAAVFGFLGGIAGGLLSAYATFYLARRPTKLVPLSEGDGLLFWTGRREASQFVVAGDGTKVLEGLRSIHAAAVSRWGVSTLIGYSDIRGWLEKGAPDQSGKPTIDKASSKNPDGSATRLVDHVFIAHG